MRRQPTVITVAGVIVVASWSLLAAGQPPLAPVRTSGQTITPVYEGWYENPDGTFSLSWGYFNRNSEEIMEIPIGADNRVEPGGPDRGQPTHFGSRRQRGVFTVVVPADFGDNEVNWILSFRGDTQTIPGHMHRDWMLDALGGGAGGDTPPVVKFAENSPEHTGPGNAPEGPLTATVGTPLPAVGLGHRRRHQPTTTAARKKRRRRAAPARHADVAPAPGSRRGDLRGQGARDHGGRDERADTTVTFTVPGENLLRVLANDRSGGGGSQCCWTNAFVRVSVSE